MKQTFKILYEDNHLLVVDKPVLLATMGVAEGDPSLVEGLKDYLRQKFHKPGNVYLGVVSRLDSWVSGVIVLARTSKAAERLNRQFRERTCQKTYLALIPDRLEFPETGRLEDQIFKNDSLHRMVVLPPGSTSSEAQIARLSYRTLGQARGMRLIEVDLETGRKHQIRVQLSAAGCPILGDQKYGSSQDFPRGIALHSFRLTINHPTSKERLTFQSLPPKIWQLDRFGFEERSKVN